MDIDKIFYIQRYFDLEIDGYWHNFVFSYTRASKLTNIDRSPGFNNTETKDMANVDKTFYIQQRDSEIDRYKHNFLCLTKAGLSRSPKFDKAETKEMVATDEIFFVQH